MEVIVNKNLKIIFCESTSLIDVEIGGKKWRWDQSYEPYLNTELGKIKFKDAIVKSHKQWCTGVGTGIKSRYEKFMNGGKVIDLVFETIIWFEFATQNLICEFIPIYENGIKIKNLFWPGYMEFSSTKSYWYTLLNIQQGLLIPNTWPVEFGTIVLEGCFTSVAAFMPWYAQIRGSVGYMAICEQPWDAAYYVNHPKEGGYTHVGMKWNSCKEHITYNRVTRYIFTTNCDYNDLAKIYRQYAKEKGYFCTLKEKIARLSSVKEFIGCTVVHEWIKLHMEEASDRFDYNSNQDRLVTFEQRGKELEQYYKKGVKKIYLHLDGWGNAGYDNLHPDYLPVCKEAGGTKELIKLINKAHDFQYLVGLHDQYRDYYYNAPSFSEEFACRNADRTIPHEKRWAGGEQTLLCATQAPYYVRRNYLELFNEGVKPDAIYLDVFTCHEGEECFHPSHKMTRKECLEYRNECLKFITGQEIVASSEDAAEWAMHDLVIVHFSPYEFMMAKNSEVSRRGIPVPLFNLVYHECIIIPWFMDILEEDYMLYALLNGGVPYLIRQKPYATSDGRTEIEENVSFSEKIKRCKIVSELHEEVAMCELVKHEIINKNPRYQRSTFSNGTIVEVDFEQNEFQIYSPKM